MWKISNKKIHVTQAANRTFSAMRLFTKKVGSTWVRMFLSLHYLQFKGTVSQDGYFFGRSKSFYQYSFQACADGLHGLLTSFRHVIQRNFLFASMKFLIIFEMLTETLIRIPFIVIGRSSSAFTPHWLKCKWAKIYLSQAAIRIILQDQGWLPVCIFRFRIVGSLRSVTERILKASN